MVCMVYFVGEKKRIRKPQTKTAGLQQFVIAPLKKNVNDILSSLLTEYIVVPFHILSGKSSTRPCVN